MRFELRERERGGGVVGGLEARTNGGTRGLASGGDYGVDLPPNRFAKHTSQELSIRRHDGRQRLTGAH